jgi:hypothetical protein
VRLLPNFDSYLLGHFEKDHIVAKSHYNKIYRMQWWISPVVLVDGRAVATWTAEKNGKNVAITVEPFEKLSGPIRERIATESSSLSGFLDVPITVSYAKN